VQADNHDFSVLAFYTAKQDPAHISFVHEANKWLEQVSHLHNFLYDSTNDWKMLRKDVLKKYDIVVFLDTRPDGEAQRKEFEHFMEHGGKWLGFHFSAFALSPSDYPQNWNWYHNHFLGSGEYGSNTWRPTSAILRVEDTNHPVTRDVETKITSAPNEWYRWKNDLRKNPDIQILLSIDSTSFPLGTGPKAHEIWHDGYYPVVWTNKEYKMVYFNMGHNDMDYEHGTNQPLSSSFSSAEQNVLILNSLKWLGKSDRSN
jgi:uncharacterized protein